MKTFKEISQKNEEIKKIFQHVAEQFEHVWYGHFHVSREQYLAAKSMVEKSPLGI